MMQIIRPLTHEQVMDHIKAINKNGDDTRNHLLVLYETESWKVLGYPNWRSMAKAEFPKWSQSYLYFQLRAARTEQGLLDTPDIEPDFSTIVESLPESHLRELKVLSDPLEQRLALQLAYSATTKAIASQKLTAAIIRDAVETVQEIKESGGKVELDEQITAAEAKVVLRHAERVQEHIDNATNKRAAKSGGTGLFIQGKARITGTANRQVFFEFESDEVITQLRKLWLSNQGVGLEIRITRKGK